MTLRRLLLSGLIAFSFSVAQPAFASDLGMTIEEFKLWRDYKDALEDERVKKIPEKKRMSAIAKNFKVPEKKLAAAVEKGEIHGEGIAAKAEAAIRAALAGTAIESRIKEIRVDATSAHVVSYVQWAVERTEQLDREAALVAVKVAKAAPISSTINIWATDPADDQRKLFEGLISGTSASRIDEKRIVDFATTRYMRLFEKVTRAE